MCGILFFYGLDKYIHSQLNQSKDSLSLRGPDNTKELVISDEKKMIFSRLSINDVSSKGDQPFINNERYYLI